MMSRRGFFGALATAAVGACVATKIPTAFLPQPVRSRAAVEYLLKHYRAHTEGAGLSGEWPRAMLVGRELYEAYESEVVALEGGRYQQDDAFGPSLVFKGAIVLAHPLTGLRRWDVMILNREQWTKARTRIKAGKPLEWVRNAA